MNDQLSSPDPVDPVPDHVLDEQVRGVPIPAGLDQRLSALALFDDAAIDRLLVCVRVPSGFAERLRVGLLASLAVNDPVGIGRYRQTPLSGAIDLDRAAKPVDHAAVVLAANAARQGSAGPQRIRRLMHRLVTDFGSVAALLLCGAGMFLGGTELSRRLGASSSNGSKPQSEMPSATVALPETSREKGKEKSLQSAGSPALPPSPSPQLNRFVPPGDQAESLARTLPQQVIASGSGSQESPSVRASSEKGLTVRGAPLLMTPADAPTGRLSVAGFKGMALPRESHRMVPRMRGYDLAFEMAHGEAPFIDPSLAPSLAVDRPPLSLRSDSFDALLSSPRSLQRTSRAGSTRCEEVLAAIPPVIDLNPAKGADRPTLQLTLAGMHSLRSGTPSDLLEVSITAKPLDREKDPPLNAVLVLDQSTGLANPLVWQWVCGGLEIVVEQMRPADRLTLVLAAERPTLAMVRGDRAELKQLCIQLRQKSPSGPSDCDAAVEMAEKLFDSAGDQPRLIVIAQTDSVERLSEKGRSAFARWQESQATGQIDRFGSSNASSSQRSSGLRTPQFILIDASRALDESGQGSSEGVSEGRIATDSTSVRRAVVQSVFGRSFIVARQCSLSVTFHPGFVARYRIVGHRQSVVESLAVDGQKPIDMHAGETVRVVYEIVQKHIDGKPRSGEILAAVVSYLPVEVSGNKRKEVVQQSTKAVLAANECVFSDALPSPHACEVLLACAIGELLDNSVHLGLRKPLMDRVTLFSMRWCERGDVTPFGLQLVSILQQQKLVTQPSRSSLR